MVEELVPQLPPTDSVPISLVLKVTSGVVSFAGVVTAVTSATVGAPVSRVKLVNVSVELVLPEASVTVTVQSEYVPSASAELSSVSVNVMVWFPVEEIVVDVLLPQLPPIVIVPVSFVVKTTLGVVSVPGVVTAVTSEITGAVVSITKLLKVNAVLALDEASVIVTVQSKYVPSDKGELSSVSVNVIV